jgi:heat-inducible transcriptional repressor
MPRTASSSHLSERDGEILKQIIARYILTAEPVSSGTVAKSNAHGLSAATIRNTMADLEGDGYLYQPHTSSGRVPTRRGYHLFIDELMETRKLDAQERRYIDESLPDASQGAELLMSSTAHLLSELSHQVSVVLTPAISETVLRAVEMVALSGTKVLCIVVSENGFVDNKVVETDEPLTREELVRISNYLSENFAGMTISQARERLIGLMAEERAQVDRMLGLSIELARRGLDPSSAPGVVVDGTTEVLSYPELADVSRMRQLFETFSRKARLVRILNQYMSGDGVRVAIGEDSDLTSELDFSLVATAYGAPGRRLGTVGIFGPSRMEYQRLIPLVEYLGESLTRALTGSYDRTRDPRGARGHDGGSLG